MNSDVLPITYYFYEFLVITDQCKYRRGEFSQG